MSWLKLDDDILNHPKFVRAERRAPSRAVHLWLGLMAFCKKHLTDGRVPVDMLDQVNGPCRRWRADTLRVLIEEKLVDQVSETELQVHDYLDWNASRQEIERKSEARRQRSDRKATTILSRSDNDPIAKRRHATANDVGDLRVVRQPSETETETETETEKIPLTPPQGSPTAGSKKKTSTRLGTRICLADFEPNPAVLKLATELGYSEVLERSTRARMIDWSIGKAVARADWQATYRNWLRKDAEERGLKPVKHDAQRDAYQAELRRANEPVKNPAKPPAGIENKIRNLFG